LEPLSPEQGREEAVPAAFPTRSDIPPLVPAIFPTGSEGAPAKSATTALLPVASPAWKNLPPVLLGSLTPEIRIRVASFYSSYSSVYEIFLLFCLRDLRTLGEPAAQPAHSALL
jgi:hypothetical protein